VENSGQKRAYKHWSRQYINKACSDYDSQSQMPQKWIALGPNTYFLTQFRKTDVCMVSALKGREECTIVNKYTTHNICFLSSVINLCEYLTMHEQLFPIFFLPNMCSAENFVPTLVLITYFYSLCFLAIEFSVHLGSYSI
jgi:hypothetical protein